MKPRHLHPSHRGGMATGMTTVIASLNLFSLCESFLASCNDGNWISRISETLFFSVRPVPVIEVK